ncbi:MAG TPA: tail fiber protein [Anaerolineales bacterium]|nr:tail fiber protein [Anaerolineales bacterium]
MSEPFLGQISIFSFNFAPRGWALCNGQLLPINQNQALFALLGTTYGGNGQTNFALPNLQGRVPLHRGEGFSQGQIVGENAHTLTLSEMPAHTHTLRASASTGDSVAPTSAVLAAPGGQIYAPADNLTSLQAASISNIGGSQPHENRQPYLVLSFCIALQGIFPSQN